MPNDRFDAPMFSRDDDAFVELVTAYLDGSISRDAFQQLSDILHEGDKQRKKFVLLCTQHQMIRKIKQTDVPEEAGEDSTFDEESAMLLREVIDQERRARIEREASAALEKQQTEDRERERRDSMRALAGLSKPKTESETKHYVIPKPLFYGSIAAVVAVAAAIILPLLGSEKQAVAPEPAPIVAIDPVAELIETVEAIWSESSMHIEADGRMKPGIYELIEGLARVRFDNGADVLLEAPVKFEVVSKDTSRLHIGKIVGYCPEESVGFTIHTSNSKIVDLGTEFGISMDHRGVSETHVFQGLVELNAMSNGRAASPPVKVKTNQARAVDPTGTRVTSVATSEYGFVRSQEFEANVKAKTSAYHRWLAYSYKLRRDPSMVAYYTFDNKDEDPSFLLNRAPTTQGELNGRLGDGVDENTKPIWRPNGGRFERNGAMRFYQSARQRVIVSNDPQLDIQEITIGIWIKPSDPSLSGHLVNLNDVDDKASMFNLVWIGEKEDFGRPWFYRVYFERMGGDGGNTEPVRSNRQLPSVSRWVHLTVTCTEAGDVNIYMDGERVGRRRGVARGGFTPESDLWIGEAHWDLITPDRRKLNEAFDGLIDELAIFNRALDANEVRAMFEAGRPD